MKSEKLKIKWEFCILYFAFLIFMGCESGGGVQDIALVKQAKREIRRIRNALEEYKLDYGAYPAQGSNLKVKLAPYLSKLFYSGGEETAEYTRSVLGAQNNLNQIRNALSGCNMIKDPEVKEIFNNIQESIKLHEAVLNGKDEEISSVSSGLSKLQEAIEGLEVQELKSSRRDSLIEVIARIIETVNSLIPDTHLYMSRDGSQSPVETGREGEELEHLENIKNTFRWYEADMLGKKLAEKKELYSPQGELVALKEKGDSVYLMRILPLQKLIDSYYELGSGMDYCDFLLATQKDIGRASKLVSMLDAKMPEAEESGVIVQAEATLRRMADAIRDYRKEKGEFPKRDTNIDSILHPYFVETTMSGECIDRWSDALSWFHSGPVYKTNDPRVNFTLEAQVNNEVHTPVMVKARIENKWDEVIGAFSEAPIYETPDSTQVYFVKARAKDSGLTWVTERPPK